TMGEGLAGYSKCTDQQGDPGDFTHHGLSSVGPSACGLQSIDSRIVAGILLRQRISGKQHRDSVKVV
ncbi:hypothetical protein, partial [Pseudomonas gessardii]|uniref:hypothetical protein n=1 Tax=Pseudomonas gessardii TaxID=78544 RepID=UPI001F468B8B